jgi:hypothetical protein
MAALIFDEGWINGFEHIRYSAYFCYFKFRSQGVLLGVAEAVELRKLGHPTLESNRP